MHSSIEDICEQIIELDKCIRFASFATISGKEVILLLTLDETQLFFIDSALIMRIREAREPKLCKMICSIVLYEKVTYATILVNSEDYPILMTSFDNKNKRTDHESLILDGILPRLSQYLTGTVNRRTNQRIICEVAPIRVITDRSNSEYFDEYHCYRTAVQCTATLLLILILLLHELIMMSRSPSENELKEIKRPHTRVER